MAEEFYVVGDWKPRQDKQIELSDEETALALRLIPEILKHPHDLEGVVHALMQHPKAQDGLAATLSAGTFQSAVRAVEKTLKELTRSKAIKKVDEADVIAR